MRGFSAVAILLGLLGLGLGMLTSAPLALAQDRDKPSSKTVEVQRKSPSAMRSEELDKLFAQLHDVNAGRQAPLVEQKIWANWGRNDSVTAELLLGQAAKALNAQEYQAAEDMLNRLVADKPDYAEAWNRRATLHFMAQRYEKSLGDIDRVLELEPRHFGALSGQGMVLEALGRPDAALKAYREALSVNPHMGAVQQAVQRLEKERPDI